MKKRAVISVSDKTGIVDFARKLVNLDFEIISTGGTYKELQENGIPVIKVSDVTGFPEIMNGRVKTLHPAIHGGILADKHNPEHLKALQEHNIQPIVLVVVNLYPFRKTISNPDVTEAEAIEQIDIGGPTMVRAAGKNFGSITIVVDQNDYDIIINELKNKGEVDLETRRNLAKKAFQHTAEYDSYISNYFSKICNEELPTHLSISLPLHQILRYGENPHQIAGFYEDDPLIHQLHGKELSFNNLQDIDAALKTMMEFEDKATIGIFKHCNPCGIGTADTLKEAYEKAFATDTQSPFGGILIANRPLDIDAALEINKIFTEIIIAPEFPDEVLERLKKKKNRRLITFDANLLQSLKRNNNIRSCMNGLLLQKEDISCDDEKAWQVVTDRKPSETEWEKLRFAWKIVNHLKSNAIAICRDDRTIGLGMGQPSRIDSTEIALWKAKKFGLSVQDCALGSDAFFPFRDTIDTVAEEGISCIIQPGGSVRDEEVIQACNEHGITMVFTSMRHFRH
ncbi:MAG: bifunctional phosphoribosylaminoimidazolecarboxamide formyltransferase/IMP cyclohydrolase [Candidatus Cloacimonetes bacterium]|nr:bifunctional phosphoribosylaminoimidazolecarboxamide formyltransferase/IMP cyclohydrolase [Candidatus Cloacimonadota bacterium]